MKILVKICEPASENQSWYVHPIVDNQIFSSTTFQKMNENKSATEAQRPQRTIEETRSCVFSVFFVARWPIPFRQESSRCASGDCFISTRIFPAATVP